MIKARVTVTLKNGVLDPQGKAIEGALGDPERLRAVLKTIPSARHLEIEGADHSLARSRKDPMAAAAEWLDAVAAFVHEVASAP